MAEYVGFGRNKKDFSAELEMFGFQLEGACVGEGVIVINGLFFEMSFVEVVMLCFKRGSGASIVKT